MNQKYSYLIRLLKEDLGLYLRLSLGVFLFVLFFQPFTLKHFDFNNQLIFIAGFGAIIFIFMVLVQVVLQSIIKNYDLNKPESVLPAYLGSTILLAINSVAIAYYLRFVGSVEITFYSMTKILLICAVPSVLIRLNEQIKALKELNASLLQEIEIKKLQVSKLEDDVLGQTIEFNSENNSENLKLLLIDIAFIKSADNYVEIAYKEETTIKKKLIRNTLKNIENQLNPFSNFIRCHRICIVNVHFIMKLNKNENNHWLTIKGYDEQIPVSRQYMLKLKEIVK